MEILARRLESESSLHRRVDLFFLVDSIAQCSRGVKGEAFIVLLNSDLLLFVDDTATSHCMMLHADINLQNVFVFLWGIVILKFSLNCQVTLVVYTLQQSKQCCRVYCQPLLLLETQHRKIVGNV